MTGLEDIDEFFYNEGVIVEEVKKEKEVCDDELLVDKIYLRKEKKILILH